MQVKDQNGSMRVLIKTLNAILADFDREQKIIEDTQL